MEKTLHRSHTRGSFTNDWLSTRYSFSFANWHDPKRMGFGALRVLNDDCVAPAQGFDMHPHSDMEIVTLVTAGELTHKDSLGNTGVVAAGDVQAMSAGTGVVHAEYNASRDTELTLFQLWIKTAKKGAEPRYAQQEVGFITQLAPGILPLIVPEGKQGGVTIRQEAYISRLMLDETGSYTYEMRSKSNGLYVFVIEGVFDIVGERLERRDALGVWDTDEVVLTAPGPSSALLIEVPMLG